MKLLLFAPRMAPLAHIHTYVDNKASQVWANRGSSKTDLYVGLILRKLSLAESRKHIYTFVGRVPGEDKKMADAALRFTHLPNRKFLSHFRTHSPQSKPWILPPLPSVCRQQLTTMLHNMQSRRVSPQPSSRRTPSPGSNSDATAAGYKFPPTSKALKTPFLSSRFFRSCPYCTSTCARATYQESIGRAIPPLDRSNIRIGGGPRPRPQPHGETRI